MLIEHCAQIGTRHSFNYNLNFKFQISNLRFRISDFEFQISNFRFPILILNLYLEVQFRNMKGIKSSRARGLDKGASNNPKKNSIL